MAARPAASGRRSGRPSYALEVMETLTARGVEDPGAADAKRARRPLVPA